MQGSPRFTRTFSLCVCSPFKLTFVKPTLFSFGYDYYASTRMVASQLNHQIILLLKHPLTHYWTSPLNFLFTSGCDTRLVEQTSQDKYSGWAKIISYKAYLQLRMLTVMAKARMVLKENKLEWSKEWGREFQGEKMILLFFLTLASHRLHQRLIPV